MSGEDEAVELHGLLGPERESGEDDVSTEPCHRRCCIGGVMKEDEGTDEANSDE